MIVFARLRILLLIPFGLLLSNFSQAASIAAQLTTTEKLQLQQEARLVVDILQNQNYAGQAFREMSGADMITRFLVELDPRAEILTTEDIEQVHRRFDRTFKTVYLFRGDLQPAFEIFDLFNSRAQQHFAWVQKRLNRGFDFTIPESYREPATPAVFASSAEMEIRWNLLLKEIVLVEMLKGRTPDEAVAEVRRRYQEAGQNIEAFDPLAIRERFLDAVIRSFDPHSGYFSVDTAREFAAGMEKSVVGVGLELRKDKGDCVITSLQLGGPADLGAELSPGDVIDQVAEGDAGDWVDLRHLRLREIVTLLRGEPDTRLRLAYRKAGDVESRSTVLTRSRVNQIVTRARGAVSELPAPDGPGHRIGTIRLPDFYTSGENGSLSSATRDVRELIVKMTANGVDGLVLDLRDNPGGALTEAVSLSELFLPEGLVMLSRGAGQKAKEHAMMKSAPLYQGPLVILISGNSASASEVFAGTMRFHNRAVVVGAAQTFGKGTMQAYIELARMRREGTANWGTLRVTTEKFFQPDGTGIQRSGIPAHIVLPGLASPQSRREADLPGAFAGESIATTAVPTPAWEKAGTSVTPQLTAFLQTVATADLKNLAEWDLFIREVSAFNLEEEKKEWSLLLTERTKDEEARRTAHHLRLLERRELAGHLEYPTIPFETDAVQTLLESQDTRLKPDFPTGHIKLRPGSIVIETNRGRLRKIPLDAIDYANFVPDSEALAAAMAVTGHPPVEPAQIATFLRDCSLLEHKSAGTLLSIGKALAPSANGNETRGQLESLLAGIVTLNGDARRERPALDVPLREAQRLANAWVGRIGPVPPAATHPSHQQL